MFCCTFCGHKALLSVCATCSKRLDAELLEHPNQQSFWKAALPGSHIPVSARWRYFGAAREAILAFKVQQNWAIGVALIREFIEDERVLELLDWADGVMPVPSSLWSRLRGRFDLAALLAENLAQRGRLAYWNPPRSFWGRWAKQSKRSRFEKLAARRRIRHAKSAIIHARWGASYFIKDPARPPRILLVDDIATSGETLANFAAYFREIELRSCCLAVSIKSLTGDD